MENPGLKRYSDGSPTTVYDPSGQPRTMEEDGPGSDPVDALDSTRRDDIMDAPPPTGVQSPDSVGTDNGDHGMGPLRVGAVLDTMRPAVQAPVNVANTPQRPQGLQPNGLPQGQVPTSVQQQALDEQQHAQQVARQNQITQQKMPGGGETTQTYRDAQQRIQTQLEQRRGHVLHRLATQNEEVDSYGPTEITPEERDHMKAVATWNADVDRTNPEKGTPTWYDTGAFWQEPEELASWRNSQWDKPEGSDIFGLVPEHTFSQPHNMVAYQYRPGVLPGFRDERWPEGSERLPSEMDVKTNVVRPPFDIKDDDEGWSDNAMDKEWKPEDAPHPLHHEASRTESVEHMLAHYQPYDFPTWQEVHDNTDWNSPLMRDFVDHVKRNGVLRPIPVDYSQDPPQVRNGHTRLLAAQKAGLDRVPVRDHEGFMDPDDPDPWGKQEGGRLLEGHHEARYAGGLAGAQQAVRD